MNLDSTLVAAMRSAIKEASNDQLSIIAGGKTWFDVQIEYLTPVIAVALESTHAEGYEKGHSDGFDEGYVAGQEAAHE